jgi:hypothetical protein
VGVVEGFDLSAFNRLWPQREEGEAFPVVGLYKLYAVDHSSKPPAVVSTLEPHSR